MNENDFLSKIQPLSKTDLKDLDPAHCWLIQSSLETKGPYNQNDLIGLVDLYSEELAECIACDLSHKRWKPFFEHKAFDKRDKNQVKPVVKEDEKSSNRYFVLLNGNRKGPYSKSDVEKFLDQGDLRLNDLLSADNGKSWRKIYHFPLFDRRKETENNDIEIATLDEQQMEKSRVFTSVMLQEMQENPSTSTAIEGALIARRRHLSKKNKRLERENTREIKLKEFISQDIPLPQNAPKKRNPLFVVASVCLLAIAAALILFPGAPKRIAKKAKKNTRILSGASDVKDISIKENEVKPKAQFKPRERTSYKSKTRDRDRDYSNDDIEIPTDPRYVEEEVEEYYEDEVVEPVRRRRRRPAIADEEPGLEPIDEFGEEDDPEFAGDDLELPELPSLEGERGLAGENEGEELPFDEFDEFDPEDPNIE